MILTLKNIKENSKIKYPILDRQIFKPKSFWHKYILEEEVIFQLSNGDILTVEKGFLWDKSTVPKFLYSFLSPIGKFEIASLIHDKIYRHLKDKYTRSFADKEMLKWSKAIQGTKYISFRNLDNYTRYILVRIFGWIAWYNYI